MFSSKRPLVAKPDACKLFDPHLQISGCYKCYICLYQEPLEL